ncbi:HEXXH motif-containing putative peptide modification protein [Vibrio rhizosphaerae]|uniref:HEXXH motif-containing putative peptide modification protein n=1 Tax=Vibrio rhizosphaerae TaxID=398736 RepID=A0ABU4IVH3_9VIBR|nr:HEXXH motif-containing putative peptide modification protein [Vibrio rhizosphaerae]MDW6093421.1 HEXXH motif-containing putative peptide modification protein [Vibrio rhizosphaerae]
MGYSFLPKLSVVDSLSKSFKYQLRDSYLEILRETNEFDSEIFPRKMHDDFSLIKPDLLNGFHSVVYHHAIELLNEEKYIEAKDILASIIYGNVDSHTGIVLNSQIDTTLLNLMLEKSIIGLDSYKIDLEPMEKEADITAKENLEYGMSILKDCESSLYDETKNLVSSIVFFSSKKGVGNNKLYSLTSNAMQSLIMIEGRHNNSWIFLLDKYIHEAAHSLLFAINLKEELFYNSEDERYSSPLRKDPRPLSGIYHATFVIQRLIYAFKNILKKAMLNTADKESIQKILEFYLERVNDGYETITKYGKLSPVAKYMIEEGQATIQSA